MPANKTPSDGESTARRTAARAGTIRQTAAGRAGGATAAPTGEGAGTASAKTQAAKATTAAKATAGATASKTTAAKTPVPKTTATAPIAKTTATKTTAKTPAAKTPATKSGGSRPSSKPAGNRASAARAARAAALGSSGNRSRPKSLAVKRRTPWGLIITCVLVVVFAAAVIGYAVTRPKKADAAYVRNEIAAAKAINGVIFKKEPDHTHVTSAVKYNTSPPTGGNHSQVWADCSGTVYPKQIANENAVHPLEHGAVWITYRPGLDAKSIATLAKLVTGQNYTLMSPYAGLKTPISLQAWNYQLFVNSATDPRIAAFIKALRNNPGTTPEYPGNCSDPTFKANPSTPGKPIWQ